MIRRSMGVIVTVTALLFCSCGGGGPAQFDGVYFGLGGDYNNGIVAGTGGRLGTTTDGGDTFIRLNLSFDVSQPQSVKSIAPPTPAYTINWDMYDVAFKDGWTGLVVGDKGGMLRTWDAGITWEKIDLGLSTKLRGVEWDLTLGSTYTFGDEGKVLKSNDDGITWDVQITPRISIVYGGCFLTGDKGWLVGEDGLFWGTEDGGTTWNDIVPRDMNGDPIDLSGNRLRDCWWGMGGYGFVVGENGTFLRTENDGTNWEKIDLGLSAEFRKINFNEDGSVGMMVGDPYIGRTLDWGKTWYSIPLSPGQELALAIKDIRLRLEEAWGVGEDDFFYRCQNLKNESTDPEPPICIQTKITF